MKNSFYKLRTTLLIASFFIVNVIVLSCENKVDLIPKSDLFTLPSITVKDSETIYTDSGKLQLIMSFPILEQYDNKEDPYTEFRSGIHVIFYDGKPEPVASVTSKYAKYTKTDNLWELKDSVVVINDNKDMLETELLFWNQQKDLIYTDRFVKISNPDQVTQAFGFESDSRLRNQKLKKVSAIIYLKEEE
jgi:LPS export ABC transporter protein LptC